MTDNIPSRIFFSVIMSCYNSERFIEESIYSVLSQSYTDWELIVVDDCSTDSTFTILQKFANLDSRISIHRSVFNQGPANARNLAASHAQGQWLSILDSDDIFLPNKLEAQFKLITSFSEELVLVASDSIHFNCYNSSRTYNYPYVSHRLKRYLFSMSKFPPHSSVVFRKSTFLKLGGYNRFYQRAQDYDLFLRFSAAGDFVSATEPLIKYRVHSSSISNILPNSGHSQFKYALVANLSWRLHNLDPLTHFNGYSLQPSLLEFLSCNHLGAFFDYYDYFRYLLKKEPTFKRFLIVLQKFTINPRMTTFSILFLFPWTRSLFLSIVALYYHKMSPY